MLTGYNIGTEKSFFKWFLKTKGSLLSLILLALFLAIIPANTLAASTPSYKYYNAGKDIGASGGQFGDQTVELSKDSAPGLYKGVAQVTAKYNDSGWSWLFNIGETTVTCKVGVQVQVNTTNTSTGTVSIYSLPPQLTGAESTIVPNCPSAAYPYLSDFQQSNISISGSLSDTAQISNLSETDEDKQISVVMYSNIPAKDINGDVRVTLSLGGNEIASQNLNIGDNLAVSNQAYFKNISPDTYEICIVSNSNFNFDKCQTVTKIPGSIASVVFGSAENASYEDGKAVEVTVLINMSSGSKIGTYGPYTINIVDSKKKVVQTGRTAGEEVNTIDGAAGSAITQSVKISPIEVGDYTACISNTDLCASFEKEANSMAMPVIEIPADDSDQLFTAAASKTSCGIPGIGWIICPVFNFMAYIADASFGFLADNFLNTSPTIFDTDKGVYDAWTSMRNIANIAFVIVFLIIIFSQVSSFGVSNYGIKKMLPRLVIAAILVNISYFICQIAVDISNILGYSIESLLTNLTPASQETAGYWSEGHMWSNIVGSVLIVGAGTTVLWGSLAMLFPVLIAAVVALIMILFILVARQAIIILLIVLSPLAFVAFLLPNTSDLFKKWQKTFTAMLMLFPVIAMVFGASKLASGILKVAFDDSTMGGIIAAGVLVVPLFIIPGLLKKSLDVIPALGQYANKFSGMANSRLSNKANEAWKDTAFSRGMEARKQYKQSYRSNQYAKRLSGSGMFGKYNPSEIMAKGIPITKESRYANDRLSSFAIAAANDADEKDVSNKVGLLRSQFGPGNLDDAAKHLATSIEKGDSTEARAAMRILKVNGAGRNKMYEVIKNMKETSSNKEAISDMRAEALTFGMKGQNIALDKWAAYGGSLSNIEQTQADMFSGLTDSELAGQSSLLLTTNEKLVRQTITPERARAMMSNPNIVKDMDENNKVLFSDIAGNPTIQNNSSRTQSARQTSTSTETPTPAGTSQESDEDLLTLEHNDGRKEKI